MKQSNIEDATRKQVADFFPQALSRALESYRGFTDTVNEIEDSKKYAEHNKAGKVAIAHIHLLLKLAEWAGLDKAPAGPDLQTLLGAAHADITRLKNERFHTGEFEEVDGHDLA